MWSHAARNAIVHPGPSRVGEAAMHEEHGRLGAEVYLVGGAVRDGLLGRPVKDRDWVVVGATHEDMGRAGFRRVGATFPVYIHPETREEYALARTERKDGTGYRGFETSHGPEVTLVDDLVRRDLTVNAMALRDGVLVDPFGGKRDLERGILRHVSEAFADDPLRVLRTARLAATYGFGIAPETLALCRRIAASGELGTLPPERVAGELRKALVGREPSRFFHALDAFGAMELLFPELLRLRGQTQPTLHHAEGDAFVHTMRVLDEAARTGDEKVGFGALVHDLGKGDTPAHLLPSHHGHEEAGVPLVNALADRLRLSNELREAGTLSARHHHHVHNVFGIGPSGLVRIFNDLDRQVSDEQARVVAAVARADHYGRVSVVAERDYPQEAYFREAMAAIGKARLRDAASPEEIAAMGVERRRQELHGQRLKAVREVARAREARVAEANRDGPTETEADADTTAFGP